MILTLTSVFVIDKIYYLTSSMITYVPAIEVPKLDPASVNT